MATTIIEVCPTPELIRDVVWEKCDPRIQQQVDEHCHHCPECHAILKGFFKEKDQLEDIYAGEFLHAKHGRGRK